jgi:hypothetical protein
MVGNDLIGLEIQVREEARQDKERAQRRVDDQVIPDSIGFSGKISSH